MTPDRPGAAELPLRWSGHCLLEAFSCGCLVVRRLHDFCPLPLPRAAAWFCWPPPPPVMPNMAALTPGPLKPGWWAVSRCCWRLLLRPLTWRYPIVVSSASAWLNRKACHSSSIGGGMTPAAPTMLGLHAAAATRQERPRQGACDRRYAATPRCVSLRRAEGPCPGQSCRPGPEPPRRGGGLLFSTAARLSPTNSPAVAALSATRCITCARLSVHPGASCAAILVR
jgi:hypothetical protein